MAVAVSTPEAPGSLLDPKALAKIGKMELVARQLMDGYVQGMHRSPHVGFALDFAQHRQYVAGDDIKRIDWRVYAKADRYYIKQYEVSTNLRCHVVLDASGSMAYRGAADALGKFRYAQFVAACAIVQALHHLRHRRHEVLLMQVMADDELTFPFRKWSLFENLERQNHRVRLDPATTRAAYLASVARHQKTIRDAAGRLNVSHVLLNTSKPFDEALTNY